MEKSMELSPLNQDKERLDSLKEQTISLINKLGKESDLREVGTMLGFQYDLGQEEGSANVTEELRGLLMEDIKKSPITFHVLLETYLKIADMGAEDKEDVHPGNVEE